MNDFGVVGNGEEPRAFIGRHNQLRAMDGAMSEDRAGILIHGPGSVGKTALVRYFARRLLDDDAISADGLFWFSLEWDIRTAEYVIDYLGIELLGIEFVLDSPETRIERLAEALNRQRCLIVWDHFEVVHGMEGTGEPAQFRPEDQQDLYELLRQLQGGKSKVLITSRGEESWLGADQCFRLNLTGFEGKERGEYGQTVLSELGLAADHTEPQFAELLDLTEGHPLAMRIMLAGLEDHSAEELCQALKTNCRSIEEGIGASEGALLAALQYAVQSVSESARPLLTSLAFHERFVDGDDLEAIATQANRAVFRTEVDTFLETLTHAGLLESCVGSIYKMHPILGRYLRRGDLGDPDESWQRAFVEVMAQHAPSFVFTKAFTGRIPFTFNDVNYRTALALADRLDMDPHFCTLLSWLSANTQNKRDFDEQVRGYRQTANAKPPADDPKAEAARLWKLGKIAWHQHDLDTAAASFRRALAVTQGTDNEEADAIASHNLGWIAQLQGDFDTAETLCQKTLRIYERHDNERSATSIYNNLGILATKQGHFDVADRWFQKARAVFERQGDESGVADSYHRFGYLAHEQRDFDAAIEWYRKSLAIKEAIGDECGAAATYHNLGMVATEQRDFDAAGEWFRKAIENRVKQGNQYDAARTYCWLGNLAYCKRGFDLAERWCRKALETAKQQGNQSAMAGPFHVLGMIIAERGDYEGADRMYQKSLQLVDNHNEEETAATYHQLGISAQRRGNLDAAETWYHKSLEIDERLSDEHGAAITCQCLGVIAQERGQFGAAEKWLERSLQIKLKQGNELGAASTYHQLGRVAEDQGDYDTAEQWYRKAIEIDEKHGNDLSAAQTWFQLAQIAQAQESIEAAEMWHRKALPIFEKYNDTEGLRFLATLADRL